MSSKYISLRFVGIGAILFLLLMAVGISSWAALPSGKSAPIPVAIVAQYTLSGRVYEGETGLEPPNSTPIQGVTVSLYCSNTQGQQGDFLRSTTTDVNGWYGLDVFANDIGGCKYLNIIETNPTNYISNGATTVGGNVITANWIEYATPLYRKTLTGNKFWDTLPVLSGYVYAGQTGQEPPDSTPIQGVTVSLYCSNNQGQQGTFLRNTTTDAQGRFSLGIQAGDACDYFNIVETDPAGYTSNGATTVGGNVITANWIEYASPLNNKTLTDNKFWDNPPATATPTSTPTSTPTGQPTATPTPTGQPTATPTPTGQPTATATPPLTCQELLVNGDFESGELAPWDNDGAVGLGPGRNSPHGVWLGDADNATGELWQRVSLPLGVDSVTLHFWWRAESPDEQPDDAVEVLVQYGHEHSDHLLTLPATAPLNTWREVSLDLSVYAGQDMDLTFFVHTDAATPTTFRLDDVSLQACAAATPTPAGGHHRLFLPLVQSRFASATTIFSDDFTDGTLTHWTANRGTWSNPGGYMQGQYTLGNAWNMRAESGENFVYQGTVRLLDGNAVGLTFRSSADGTASYDVILDAVDGVFKISKRPPYTVLATHALTVQRNRAYHIAVKVHGNRIEAYLDGAKLLVVTDSTYSDGRFGVMLFRATATYDDLRAYRLP